MDSLSVFRNRLIKEELQRRNKYARSYAGTEPTSRRANVLYSSSSATRCRELRLLVIPPSQYIPVPLDSKPQSQVPGLTQRPVLARSATVRGRQDGQAWLPPN